MSENRKIIQITANLYQAHQNQDVIESLYALCDDGSVWENTFTWCDTEWNGWKKLPPLPGVEDDERKED